MTAYGAVKYGTHPYGFQRTKPDYIIQIDWQQNGHFEGAYNFVCPTFLKFERGKNDELGYSITGMCELRLNNSDDKYSPKYSSSPLYGYVKPGREIRVLAHFDRAQNEPYTLFRGRIDTITPHPHYAKEDCYILALDGMDILTRADVSTGLHEDQKTGVIIGDILDKASWSSARRTLDTGVDTLPYVWWNNVKAMLAINQLGESQLGSFWVDGAGYARWEDRHHRLKGAHMTPRFEFDNIMVDIPYEYSMRGTINRAVSAFIPKAEQASAVIWTLEEGTPAIAPGETYSFEAEYGDPAKDVITPVANTDYTINSEAGGGGDDLSGDMTVTFTGYGAGAVVSILSAASVIAYITLFQIRGKSILNEETITRTAEDSASQDDYGIHSKQLTVPFQSSLATAEGLAKWLVATYKDPTPNVNMAMMNADWERWQQILALDISDRITVKNTKLGLDDDYYINKVKHRITQGGLLHSVQWALEDASDAEYWILGKSQLGTGTRLCY